MARIALIYTLLDGQTEIGVPHLRAALAVWEYCEASAAFIFGDSLGDAVADDILRALQRAGSAGLTRTAIRDLLGRTSVRGSDRRLSGSASEQEFGKGGGGRHWRSANRGLVRRRGGPHG